MYYDVNVSRRASGDGPCKVAAGSLIRPDIMTACAIIINMHLVFNQYCHPLTELVVLTAKFLGRASRQLPPTLSLQASR